MLKAAAQSNADDDDWNAPQDRHRKRQKKSGGPMILLVIGWSIVMAGILLFASRWKGNEARLTDWTPSTENQLTAEDRELLNKHAEICQIVVRNVLELTTPEQLSPFVFNVRDTFSDMVRFYQMNSGSQISETEVMLKSISVIHLPEGPAIEGRWRTEDDRLIDAVFREDEEGWRLDWHHFVRFSEFPWALFLAGNGPEQAEFRLLVRQRLTRRTLDYDEERPMSLDFHAPRFGRPDEPGPASPAFELDWESEAAQMLMAGFNQAREGRRPFRSVLPNVEPDDEMMRVRVVVRRIEEEDKRRFEIVEVRACHWLQLDDPGVSLDDPEETEAQ